MSDTKTAAERAQQHREPVPGFNANSDGPRDSRSESMTREVGGAQPGAERL
jgi:hypothetical protein